MGPMYFKRLLDLHQMRRDALKHIVMKPPVAHPPVLTCRSDDQRKLTTAWAHVVAELAWDTNGSETFFFALALFARFGADHGAPCQTCLRTRCSLRSRRRGGASRVRSAGRCSSSGFRR